MIDLLREIAQQVADDPKTPQVTAAGSTSFAWATVADWLPVLFGLLSTVITLIIAIRLDYRQSKRHELHVEELELSIAEKKRRAEKDKLMKVVK